MRARRCIHLFALALGLSSLPTSTGCRTPGLSGTTDLTEPGWRFQRGQAIWRREAAAPEIAGELLVATHPDGRNVVEFTKTPLPLLVAEVSPRGWRARFVLEDRSFSGPGRPPGRLLWLHLPALLRGDPLPRTVQGHFHAPGQWELEHPATGEHIEGYLDAVP